MQKTKATYTNVYMHLMEEGPKNEEKIREKVKTKEAIKETKKQEKNTKKIIDGIPEGVPKIGEVYSTIDKDERMAAESKREQKIHTETLIKK